MLTKNSFYQTKFDILRQGYIDNGFNVKDSYEIAEKRMEFDYDETGRYLR